MRLAASAATKTMFDLTLEICETIDHPLTLATLALSNAACVERDRESQLH
jgi:hypothetical protein